MDHIHNTKRSLFSTLALFSLIAMFTFYVPAFAQAAVTASPTTTTTTTATPTATLTTPFNPTSPATFTPVALSRPFIIIQSYYTTPAPILPSREFELKMIISNSGESPASDLVVNLPGSGDALPVRNGGVHTIQTLNPGAVVEISQQMLANQYIGTTASTPVQISYSDPDKVDYTQSYTLAFSGVPAVATMTAQPYSTVYGRPFVAVENYETGLGLLLPAQTFTLNFDVTNTGQLPALNLSVTFEGSDFIPVQSLGTFNIPSLPPGGSSPITQPMLVNKDYGAKSVISTVIKVNYNDDTGKIFEEKYTISFPTINTTATVTPTPTATLTARPDLLIMAYTSDVEMLRPGDLFNLDIQVINMGSVTAHSVNMILGGIINNSTSSTPQADSSTTSGEAATFAPVNSASRKFLGDIAVNSTVLSRQKMIVNVGSQAGARPLSVSFTYTDDLGNSQTDTQTVTLLVYSQINVQIGFSGGVPAPLIVDQPSPLSLQITNLGKANILLGEVSIKAGDAEIENTTGIVGPIDSGGYFTADAKITPKKAGPLKLTVKIAYQDDFGKTRYITHVLILNVKEPPTPIPAPAVPPQTSQGGLWEQIVGFLRGLFGIENAPPQPEMPPENPQSAPSDGGGGGPAIQKSG